MPEAMVFLVSMPKRFIRSFTSNKSVNATPLTDAETWGSQAFAAFSRVKSRVSSIKRY